MRLTAPLSAAAVIVSSLLAAACSSASPATVTSSDGKTSITIGVLASQTGTFAQCGVEQANSVKLWVDNFNASQKKYNISLDIADDQSTASGALSAMESVLGNKNVVAVIGECNTDIADATVPLATSDGRPVVYFSASAMPGRGPNLVSLNPPQNQLSGFAANWLFTKTKAKTVSIITLDSTTEEVALPGVVDAAKALGVKILSNQSVGATVTNFQAQVLNAMVGNPSVIVDMASPADTGSMVKELRQNGYKGAIIGSEAAAQSATFKTGGPSISGLYVPTFWDQALGATSPLTKAYVSGYEKAFAGQPVPDVYGAAAYDAANVVTTAIERVGTSKDALVKALDSGTFDGVEGSAISFNSGGFAKLSNTVIQFNAQGATTVVATG